jgi:hypothetical protein
MQKTERGFNVYLDTEDTYGHSVRVQESSKACEHCVWIFCSRGTGVETDDSPQPHLNRKQAREVARALLRFSRGGRPARKAPRFTAEERMVLKEIVEAVAAGASQHNGKLNPIRLDLSLPDLIRVSEIKGKL